MLLKLIRVLFRPAITVGGRLPLHARLWRQRRDRRQATELQGMSARELNDLGIGRGEIPYLLLNGVPSCGDGVVKVGSRSKGVMECQSSTLGCRSMEGLGVTLPQ